MCELWKLYRYVNFVYKIQQTLELYVQLCDFFKKKTNSYRQNYFCKLCVQILKIGELYLQDCAIAETLRTKFYKFTNFSKVLQISSASKNKFVNLVCKFVNFLGALW